MSAGTLPADDVRTMFDRIAPVYDAMNRVMTAGLDQRWRRETVEAVVRPGDRVLDACCGTGDLAVAALEAGAREVVGLDFSPRMLERARAKQQTVTWLDGDVTAMPFQDGEFDSATVGFGVRNVADLLAPFYRLWFDRIVPLLGKLLEGGSAYTYLPASVRRFPGPAELAVLMREAGFDGVAYRTFAGGIVALHTGARA